MRSVLLFTTAAILFSHGRVRAAAWTLVSSCARAMSTSIEHRRDALAVTWRRTHVSTTAGPPSICSGFAHNLGASEDGAMNNPLAPRGSDSAAH